MKNPALPAFLAMSILVLAFAASRAEGDCGGYDEIGPEAELFVAVVAGSGRANFVKGSSDGPGCPSLAASCRERAYLVPGDRVIVSGTSGVLSCAAYVDPSGLVRAGWLPSAALRAAPADVPRRLDDWVGAWVGGPEQSLAVARGRSGELAIEGEATYGALDPARVRRGAVNSGSLEATAKPDGAFLSFTMGDDGTLAFDEGDETACRAQLRLLGPFLLVRDNNACGGANVSFTGAYRRKR